MANERPQDVGILAMEWYAPQTYVAQTSLEEQDGCAGKYVVGLGQEAMAFVDDREDIGSVLLTACRRLLRGYGVEASEVGRLEVGTETLVDKSKSVKTTLLRLFAAGGADVEGVSSVNACYGGTAAVLNSVAWVESSAWDGRYAVVVCGDIAVYEPGPARPSGGCGAVAMLIGPDAPLALEPSRATHAMDVWDFYKPHHSEYAAVDGKLSQACYLRSVDACWRGLKAKGPRATAVGAFDHCVFHAPYNKLVQKGFARLALGDAVLGGAAGQPCSADAWCTFGDDAYEATLVDRGLDGALRKAAAADYDAKVAPSTMIPKHVGNTYTASVFAGLLSLVSAADERLAGKRVLLFSYGSGSVATMYVLRGRTTKTKFTLAAIKAAADVDARLKGRVPCSAAHFAAACDLRVDRYGKPDYAPEGTPPDAPVPLAPDAFRLVNVDANHVRSYA